MRYAYTNKDGIGKIVLLDREAGFEQNYFEQKAGFTFHTIAWNTGPEQMVIIDEAAYRFGSNSVLPLMLNQSFRFDRPEDIVAWQFNRDFYCIVNHDAEVGCVGFLFFGPSPTMFVKLEATDVEMMNSLLNLFKEEYQSEDDIKSEMLRMLLVRLIIKATRLAKKQYIVTAEVAEEKFNLIRQFNLLVEIHFRTAHQVQFYAAQLHKSPKTISNIFSIYSKRSPQEIIQQRVVMEAKRLFYYTDKSIKEIADELGFEDAAHFSKYFKNVTSQSPSALRKKGQKTG